MKNRSLQIWAVLMLVLLAVAFLAACETSTAPQPTATAKPATPSVKTPGPAATPSPQGSYPLGPVISPTPYP